MQIFIVFKKQKHLSIRFPKKSKTYLLIMTIVDMLAQERVMLVLLSFGANQSLQMWCHATYFMIILCFMRMVVSQKLILL